MDLLKDFEIVVDEAGQGARLDALLADAVSTASRSLVRRAIDEGHVTVNGRVPSKGLRLSVGDRVFVSSLREKSDVRVLPDDSIVIRIIHVDNALLTIDKLSGMPVHPIRPDETGTVANGLIARYPELAEVGGNPLFPAILHRLDCETSGLLLVARTGDAYRRMRGQFAEHAILKEYLAVVDGTVSEGGRIEAGLVRRRERECLMGVTTGDVRERGSGFHALTEYEPLGVATGYSLLRVAIRTGVTHQIRCHLASMGHPVAGDSRYGGNGPSPGSPSAPRLCLHAWSATFAHPVTGQRTRMEAPLAEDIVGFLGRIGLASSVPGRLRT